MGWREEFTRAHFGFATESDSVVDMDVSFLLELAREEAPFRNEEDTEESKQMLFRDDAYSLSKRLSHLLANWDSSKCEPLDIKKEGTLYMINNGFHRIRVASDLGIKKLPVSLKVGKFIISKHINVLDMPSLLKMLQLCFPEFKTFKELEEFFLTKVNNSKLRNVYIGYGHI
jgi:hypothetical protein